MRRVIIRFLQKLEVEKNASPATIAAYQHDLKKFHEYLVQQMAIDFFQGMFPEIIYGITWFGWHGWAIEPPMVLPRVPES